MSASAGLAVYDKIVKEVGHDLYTNRSTQCCRFSCYHSTSYFPWNIFDQEICNKIMSNLIFDPQSLTLSLRGSLLFNTDLLWYKLLWRWGVALVIALATWALILWGALCLVSSLFIFGLLVFERFSGPKLSDWRPSQQPNLRIVRRRN